jgi:4-hydroxybenzoate polyprenyltransferase
VTTSDPTNLEPATPLAPIPSPGLVPQLRAVASDIKLSHSIFALPFALLSAFLAAQGFPGYTKLGLIVLCMVLARTVGMAANRILDAHLDAANPRTAARALPAGRVSPGFYVAVLGICAVAFHAACSAFYFLYANPWPALLSVPVLAYLACYPLMKRYTRFCHYYLGIALALAPICACLAIAGEVHTFAIVMSAAVALWTAGFDILYATQDVKSDHETGVHSIPAKMGIGPALWVARISHILAAVLLIMLPATASQLGLIYSLGSVAAAALLFFEHWLVSKDNLSRINLAFFTLNGCISLLVGLLGIVDVLM